MHPWMKRGPGTDKRVRRSKQQQSTASSSQRGPHSPGPIGIRDQSAAAPRKAAERDTPLGGNAAAGTNGRLHFGGEPRPAERAAPIVRAAATALRCGGREPLWSTRPGKTRGALAVRAVRANLWPIARALPVHASWTADERALAGRRPRAAGEREMTITMPRSDMRLQ